MASSKTKRSKTAPKAKLVLTVAEVANRLGVSGRHIADLIDEGQLAAIDVSGRRDCFPMPKAAVGQLATRLKVTPDQLLEFIRTFKPAGIEKRKALWRVPVESYTAFVEKRNSLTPK